MFNYHTHTYRCKHAEGDVRQYASEAVRAGIKVLGMSDHIPYSDGRWSSSRMEFHEMEGYVRAVDEAAETFPELKIFRALESEYLPEYADYYRKMKEKWSLDYMIGAVHWFPFRGEWLPMSQMTTPDMLKSFTDHMISIIESGMFLFIAHPDNFGSGYLSWDEHTESCSREIIRASVRNNVPLEINGYGFRKRKISTPEGERRQYPLDSFWKIAGEYSAPVIFNSDAHKPEDVNANREDGEALIRLYNLKTVDPMGVCCG